LYSNNESINSFSNRFGILSIWQFLGFCLVACKRRQTTEVKMPTPPTPQKSSKNVQKSKNLAQKGHHKVHYLTYEVFLLIISQLFKINVIFLHLHFDHRPKYCSELRIIRK
jgi:hypothetical protein